MLLHRPLGTARLPKETLLARFAAFSRGDWTLLLEASTESTPRFTGPQDPSSGEHFERACQYARQGELSRARQALMAEPLAPGTDTTLRQLRDPARRPQHPYPDLPPVPSPHTDNPSFTLSPWHPAAGPAVALPPDPRATPTSCFA
eukprot:Skav202970  [mRNA]  locus=scaffold2274:430064:430501:- [translate_table: standard]